MIYLVCRAICPDCERHQVFGIQPVFDFQTLVEAFADNLVCKHCGSNRIGIAEMSIVRDYDSYDIPLYKGAVK